MAEDYSGLTYTGYQLNLMSETESLQKRISFLESALQVYADRLRWADSCDEERGWGEEDEFVNDRGYEIAQRALEGKEFSDLV